MDGTVTKRSICGICSQQCMVSATVEDGVLKKTRRITEPEYKGCSNMCIRGAANSEYVNHPDRVKTPMRRVGKKGEGRFEPISWDEAIDEISKKLLLYRSAYGPDSVAFYTGYSKWYRPFLQRLAWKFGSINYGTESSTCFRSTTVAQQLNTGLVSNADLANAGVILCVASTHLWPVVKERVKSGKAVVIVVDPRTSKDIEEYAAVHLRPTPGTDAAIAWGLAKLLIDSGAVDTDYIKKHVYGYDAYRQYADAFDPDTVERITGVPAADIRKAAELIAANKPFCVMDGMTGVIHHRNGMQTHRAYACLTAITGCYGLPGGNLPQCHLTINGHPKPCIHSFEFSHPEKPCGKRIGEDNYPLWAAVTDEFQAVDLARHITEQKPYPLKAVFALGMNARMLPGSGEVFKALEKLDFFVDCDLFMTDTAKYADIFLPAAASTERDQLVTLAMDSKAVYTYAVSDPGEARSDEDIVCELAKAMGVDGELLARGKDACYEYELRGMPCTLAELKAGLPPVKLPPAETPPRPLEEGFATPTGKFELFSTVIANLDSPKLNPLPVYTDPMEPCDESYPMILVSGVKAGNYDFAFQSRTHRVPVLRKLHPVATADMHPDDLARLGIEDGATVEVSTPHGAVRLASRADGNMLKGTVSIFEDYPEADVNSLFAVDYTDPYTGFPGFKSLRCAVKKV